MLVWHETQPWMLGEWRTELAAMLDGREKRWRKACISHDCVLGTGNWFDGHKYASRYPVGRFNKTGGHLNKKKPCRNMGFNLMDMYVTSMGPFPRRLPAFLRSHHIWPLTHIEKEIGPVPFLSFLFFLPEPIPSCGSTKSEWESGGEIEKRSWRFFCCLSCSCNICAYNNMWLKRLQPPVFIRAKSLCRY